MVSQELCLNLSCICQKEQIFKQGKSKLTKRLLFSVKISLIINTMIIIEKYKNIFNLECKTLYLTGLILIY